MFAISIHLGCRTSPQQEGQKIRAKGGNSVSETTGESEARQFDFGPVVSGPGEKLVHQYKFVNDTPIPLRVLRSINAKPCCGEVSDVVPTILEPGGFIEFSVTVKVGDTIGLLQHRALLEFDRPEGPMLEYWTFTTVHPRIRVDGPGQASLAVMVGQTARRQFSAISHGTK